MIALDLFAALMAADLPNRCMIVLAEVLLPLYGPHKRRSVFLDPPQIEHYTGLHRNNARKAIAELVEAGILRANEDGSHRFVKDYESWDPGGLALRDRLKGGLIRFTQSAKGRFGRPPERIKKSRKDPIQGDCGDNPVGLPKRAEVNPTGLPKTGAPQSNGIVPEADSANPFGDVTSNPATVPMPPLAGAGAYASEDKRELRGRDSLRSSLPERGGGGEGGEVGPLTHEGPDGVVRPIPPQVRNDPAEVDRVAAMAEEMFPLLEFGRNVRRYAAMYPIEWIERSLGVSASYRNPPSSFIPIYNRLQLWQRQGSPPELEPQPAPAGRPTGAGKGPARTLDETLAGMAAARLKSDQRKARLEAAAAEARRSDGGGA